MKHELIKSTADAMSIGEVFHKSGMFSDIKSAQQAVVKIMAGAEMGISPFQAMSGIHIIQGKPTIGAGLMASRVKASGKYNYTVIEMSDAVCTIEYTEKGQSIGVSTFTIEDARKAGTKNLERFPRNMLFARAMSNGVRWYCPDIYEGPVYVPEEMEQVTEDAVIVGEKKTLDNEQWQRLLKSVKDGKDVNGIPMYEWAIANIDMTTGQRAELDSITETDLVL